MDKIEELKKEADELGIVYSKNIGEAKLKEKIDAFYESQETGIELGNVDTTEDTEEPSGLDVVKDGIAKAEKVAMSMREKAVIAEAAARKTKIVYIVDNDQRTNNKTNSFTVNCSKMYFDLGTMILPLNVPVEVRQGHLDVLREIKIPQHALNPKTGLSEVHMRSRFSISDGEGM
jgi:hypothetical protein